MLWVTCRPRRHIVRFWLSTRCELRLKTSKFDSQARGPVGNASPLRRRRRSAPWAEDLVEGNTLAALTARRAGFGWFANVVDKDSAAYAEQIVGSRLSAAR